MALTAQFPSPATPVGSICIKYCVVKEVLGETLYARSASLHWPGVNTGGSPAMDWHSIQGGEYKYFYKETGISSGQMGSFNLTQISPWPTYCLLPEEKRSLDYSGFRAVQCWERLKSNLYFHSSPSLKSEFASTCLRPRAS